VLVSVGDATAVTTAAQSGFADTVTVFAPDVKLNDVSVVDVHLTFTVSVYPASLSAFTKKVITASSDIARLIFVLVLTASPASL